MAWHELWVPWRAKRKDGPQWFRRTEPGSRPDPAAATPQPIARPVKGQRPANGAHRPTQKSVRFGGRSRKVKVRVVQAKAGRSSSNAVDPVEVSAGGVDD